MATDRDLDLEVFAVEKKKVTWLDAAEMAYLSNKWGLSWAGTRHQQSQALDSFTCSNDDDNRKLLLISCLLVC